MVRLTVPKSQKTRKRNLMSMSNQLSSITHFSDITALTGGEGRQVGSDDINSQLLITADGYEEQTRESSL